MIVLTAAILGAILGFTIAKRRKGKALDILQYTVIYAIAFSLLGVFATLTIHRMAL
ncbi:hypothetical protein [Shimia biformata]|uniref:hypothetical protein n=1 Tax=Shimia biformata TaxID=1294299 RepID=UPI00194DCEB6|nr:hypothetical protein [Shimia biformata]